jgi:SAM-dependent methyltransferase
MAIVGREQAYNTQFNPVFRAYFFLFGAPELGAKLRALQVLRVVRGLRFERVLDAGCGKGYIAFHIARHWPAAEVVGVDTDTEKLRINDCIRNRFSLENLAYHHSDLTRLGRFDRGFDLALSVDNLEHIEDDMAALRSIHANLVPGGKLLVHVPRVRETHLLRASAEYVVPDHVRPGYEAEDLAEKLERSGFHVHWVRGAYPFFPSLANQIGISLNRSIFLYAAALPLLFALAHLPEWLIPQRWRFTNTVMALAERCE